MENVEALCTDGETRIVRVSPNRFTGTINGRRASVSVDGKTVSGFLIEDRELFRFMPNENGVNSALLPSEFKE